MRRYKSKFTSKISVDPNFMEVFPLSFFTSTKQVNASLCPIYNNGVLKKKSLMTHTYTSGQTKCVAKYG